MQEQIARLRNQLTIERRIKAVTHSLAQLETATGNNPHSMTKQATELSCKTEQLSEDLIKLMEKSSDIERQLLEHTASALREAMLWMEKRSSNSSKQQLSPSSSSTKSASDTQQQQRQQGWMKKLKDIIQRYQLELNERDETADSGYYSSSRSSSSSSDGDGDALINMLERGLDEYKSKLQQLQRQIESIEEMRRLDMLSIKKQEVQLRAMQDKYEAAEAKCKTLEQEMEKSSSSNPLDEELARLDASLNSFATTSGKDKACRYVNKK